MSYFDASNADFAARRRAFVWFGLKVKAFSLAPGAVYGYAAFFTAFLAGTDALQSASLGNPLILTALSG